MKKYNIVIATQYPKDISRPHGGVESVSLNLVKALSEYEDFEVNVVTLNKEVEGLQIENVGKAVVHRLPMPQSSELVKCISSGKKLVSQYISSLKPNLIHSHDVYGIMCGDLHYPTVFTVHGFIYEDTKVSKKKMAFIRSLIWKYVETNGWKKQKNIVSISPYVREKLGRFTKARIYDIDNPIADRFYDIRTELNDIVFFCAAVISPRKNTYMLVESFERLLDTGVRAKLRIAGRVVNEEYGDKVIKKINNSKYKDSIKYLGTLSSKDVMNEMENASVFVLLSLEENSPMGIEEAMAVGLPVITSNSCGMPYMIKHGESGFLVDPHDLNEIVGRMEELSLNKDLLHRMSEASRQIAIDRFHPKKVSSKTRDVYLEILKRDRGN